MYDRVSADAIFGGLGRLQLVVYVVAQIVGAAIGVVMANLMFALPAVTISTHARSSPNVWLSECLATFGLLLVIFGVARSGRGAAAPFAVGAYITGAYFFTSSTSFANPAVTLARTLSDTFAGIAPGSVLPFILVQLLGGAIACGVVRVIWPRIEKRAHNVIVPHEPAEVVR
jgi:glycerol uptake facilitator-like aquaporin